MYINELKSREDLALLLKMPLNKLTHILYKEKPNNMYESFEIPKKNGEFRVIESPNKALKSISKLEGCEAHSTYIVQNGDLKSLHKLKINLTCEAEFISNNIL